MKLLSTKSFMNSVTKLFGSKSNINTIADEKLSASTRSPVLPSYREGSSEQVEACVGDGIHFGNGS